LYYPKAAYCGRIAMEFRELPENKQQLCREEHDERHATELPPERPTTEVMLGAIALAKTPV
jgi:hypothetical protein